MPFSNILEILSTYDIGLGIIPNTPLYSVSSPIKAMEYAGNAVIPLLNDLPEYLRLFDKSNAFFTANNPDSITKTLEEILSTAKISYMQETSNFQKRARENGLQNNRQKFL